MAKNLILKISEKGAKKTTSSLKKVGSAVAFISKASAIAGAGVATLSTKLAGDFQKNLKEISTLMNNSTNRDLQKMSKELRLVSQASGLALDSLSKAKYDIISAGFSNAADSAKILSATSKLAVGGVTSAAEAADILTTSLNALGLTADDVNEVSDSLFTTVRLGKTTMSELASSMGQVLPFARSAGLSLDGVNSAMATITASGISTAQATTALRAALVSLTSPADSSKKAMEEAGIEIKRFDDGTLDLVGTVKQFQGLDPDTFKKIIPRVEAILGIQTMANNFDTLTKNVNTFATEAAGATEKAFEKMASGFNQQMAMLKNSIQSVLIEIGTVIISIIQPKLEEVNKEFAKLGEIGFDNLAKAVKNDLPTIMKTMVKIISLILDNIDARLAVTRLKIQDAFDPFNSIKPEAFAKLNEKIVLQNKATADIIGDLFKGMYDDIIAGAEIQAKVQKEMDEELGDNKLKQMLSELDSLRANLEAKKSIKDEEVALEEETSSQINEIRNSLSEEDKQRIVEELENKNILYNATLAAHDQFVNTLTDAEMHGAERRKKIEEAVKNSAIRFLGEHTKAFIKKKMQEVAFENATNQIKLGSQKATALKSFLIDKGKAFGSVIASMAEASAKMIAAAGPFALIAAPAIIAAVGALGSALKSQIESGQGALGFADGGIVPGANRGQGDTVPAMLTPGELILNQSQQENLARGMSGITINFNGAITNDEYVKDFIIPEIEKTISQNLA